MLLRADREEYGAWRLHLDFISVLFGTLHRRALLRSIRAKVRSSSFKSQIARLVELAAVDFAHVAAVIGDKGGMREALLSADVSAPMKGLLNTLHLVQMNVRCTDGARTKMRHQMKSLQVWAGFPVAFMTLNPADGKHPFTLRYSVEGLALQEVGFPCTDEALLSELRSARLARTVAKDPVAAVQAFHTHVMTCFEQLCGCSMGPASLAVDGVALSLIHI